jgi:hypothetical protein
MYRKQQPEEYLQKVTKAALATPTDSAVAMGLAAFTTDNRPLMAKIDKPIYRCSNQQFTVPVSGYAEEHLRRKTGIL